MDWRNRLGIYGSYLCGTAGIGFTLPFLSIYLGQEGLSDRTIGWISTCAALSGLAQFPVGIWSDWLGSRKPFLIAAAALLTVSAGMLEHVHSVIAITILIVLFAENGICRAIIESLTGAEVTAMCPRNEIGGALGSLRIWKPIGIVCVALFGSLWAQEFGVTSILTPVAVIQGLGFLAVLFIHEPEPVRRDAIEIQADTTGVTRAKSSVFADVHLWAFILAMVLFHAANAPGGVYLGLHLKREMSVPDSWLAYAFIISMLAWMLVVWPCGRLADQIGRRPLLILAWSLMSLRLMIVAVATSPIQIVFNQFLDGAANGLFSVVAATWVTDRLAAPGRSGEAQVIVGTSQVLGSAIGPAISAMIVDQIGYRALFAGLACVGAIATAVVLLFVPETFPRTAILPPIEPSQPETHAPFLSNRTVG